MMPARSSGREWSKVGVVGTLSSGELGTGSSLSLVCFGAGLWDVFERLVVSAEDVSVSLVLLWERNLRFGGIFATGTSFSLPSVSIASFFAA